MLINWFTVVAQIVNFLILVLLLKYLLYDRIISGMEEREDDIKGRFDDAEKREEEARKQKEQNDQEKEKIERKKEDILNEAKEEVDKKRKEMLNRAEDEADVYREELMESLEKDRETFIDELRLLASKQVYSVTRKVIKDLADNDLDEMIFAKFMSLLKDLEDDRKREISSAADREKGIVIKSRSELSKELRGKMTRMVHEEINSDSEVSYEIDQDMMPGIELRCGGKEITWSIEKYLEELEKETNKTLDKHKNKLKERAEEKNKKDDDSDAENERGEN